MTVMMQVIANSLQSLQYCYYYQLLSFIMPRGQHIQNIHIIKNIHAAYKHTNTYIIHSSKAREIANGLLPKTVHLRNIR